MSCSKSSLPKLYLDIRPYSQNTFHKLFSRVMTVASFALLTSLHRKCSKRYSAYFGKNMTCCTQDKYFPNTQGNCHYCFGTTVRIEGRISVRFWETGPRHIITWKFVTDIWSHRQIITLTFDHSDNWPQRQIITLQINGTLNNWKQAFPVWEVVWDTIILGI
jgi:hypothetical protein